MTWIKVDIPQQQLFLYDQNGELKREYLVSTAKKGVGEQLGSEQTPRGWHIVRAKIGAGVPHNTVFVRRRPTGEVFGEGLRDRFPGRDWILTRILWLSGLECGKNRLGRVDTMRRHVYCHGTPDSTIMGQPGSRGCIRMRNNDIIDLFNLIPVGAKVLICE